MRNCRSSQQWFYYLYYWSNVDLKLNVCNGIRSGITLIKVGFFTSPRAANLYFIGSDIFLTLFLYSERIFARTSARNRCILWLCTVALLHSALGFQQASCTVRLASSPCEAIKLKLFEWLYNVPHWRLYNWFLFWDPIFTKSAEGDTPKNTAQN